MGGGDVRDQWRGNGDFEGGLWVGVGRDGEAVA